VAPALAQSEPPKWDAAIVPEVHYSSWNGSRGYPSGVTLTPGSGSQIYAPTTVQLISPTTNDFKVNLSGKFGYVWSQQTTSGQSGEVSTMTDTTAVGTVTYVGVNGVQPYVSLALNLPTGRSALYGSSANARMDPDFVDLATFGEGLNIGPSVGVNIPLSASWIASVAFGYTHHGSYAKEAPLDPTVAIQGTQILSPGQDMTGTVSIGYAAAPITFQASGTFTYETVTYLDGTPSFQLGDGFVVTSSASYAWNSQTTSAITGTWSENLGNKALDTTVPAFLNQMFNANSQIVQARFDQIVNFDKWTGGPFASVLYRSNNSFDPQTLEFVPAKTLWSAGAQIKYAASDKVTLGASVAPFWARELETPELGIPVVRTQGWKSFITGRITF
jgi:hypothetical protein